jgi:hypothetical protein
VRNFFMPGVGSMRPARATSWSDEQWPAHHAVGEHLGEIVAELDMGIEPELVDGLARGLERTLAVWAPGAQDLDLHRHRCRTSFRRVLRPPKIPLGA